MLKSTCLCFGLTVVTVALLATDVQAQVAKDAHSTQMSQLTCFNRAADVTLAFGAGVSSVSSPASTTAYGTRIGCPRWVVDVTVPSNSSGTVHDLRSFSVGGADPNLPSTKAACESVEIKTMWYRKRLGDPSFTDIGSVTEKGVFNGEPGALFPCVLSVQPGSTKPAQPFNPPQIGTNTYRIVRSVKIGGAWQPVTVTASHTRQPPS
jgi:hypothetical protein